MVFSVRSGIGMRRRHFSRSIGEITKLKLSIAFRSKETISLYRQGEFIDLCRGPHVPLLGS
jgi:threonyl-tRNA synthetase